MDASTKFAWPTTVSPDTLAQIYSNAQVLSGIAPLAAPYGEGGLDRSLAATSHYPIQFEEARREAEKNDDTKVSKPKPVDPLIFDLLLTNELNRRLKKSFGIAFLVITCCFTIISYAIVVLASVLRWNIPEAALTALVVQAPIQMIGILYIIAKNLFPTLPVEPKKG